MYDIYYRIHLSYMYESLSMLLILLCCIV